MLGGRTWGARPAKDRPGLPRGTFRALLCAVAIVAGVNPVRAHTPHDDIFDVAVSPTYASDRMVFTISRGLLLKSEDGGQTWRHLVRGLDNKQPFTALEMSARSSQLLFVSSPRDGVYRSKDGGETWSRVSRGLPKGKGAAALAMSPHSDDVIYAIAAKRRLYRTLDGGENWSRVEAVVGKVTAVAFPSDDSEAVFVGDNAGILHITRDGGATWQRNPIAGAARIRAIGVSPIFATDLTLLLGTDGRGLLRTTDGGASLQPLGSGLPAGSISSIMFSPAYVTDATVWVSAADHGVFISSDRGAHWSPRTDGLTANRQVKQPRFRDRVSFGRLYLAPGGGGEPEQTFFLERFNGLFRSTDDGRRWEHLETLSSGIIVGLAVSPGFARDGIVAVTTYINGAFLSHDAGVTWSAINAGLEQPKTDHRVRDRIARLFFVAFSPAFPDDKAMFSSSAKGVLLSSNGGSHWQEIRPQGSQLREGKARRYMAAVSPDYARDRTIVIGESSGEIFRSTDGGASFLRIGEVPERIESFVPSPMFGSDSTLFAGTRGGVFRSSDRGGTWTLLGLDGHDIAAIAVSPGYATDQTIFAGAGDGLFVTRDGGARWDDVGADALGPHARVLALAVSPNFELDGIVLASVQGRGLLRSTDGGTAFEAIGEALSGNGKTPSNFSKPTAVPIVFSPDFASDQTLLAYSATELYMSRDAGDSWTNLALPRTLHLAEASAAAGRSRTPTHIQVAVILFGPFAIGAAYLLRRARGTSRRLHTASTATASPAPP